MIQLPAAGFRGIAFEVLLRQRRSVRGFAERPVEIDGLSQLCFAAMGLTGAAANSSLRTAPSAGAIYPLELYAVIQRVAGVPPGAYRYRTATHSLEPRRAGDLTVAMTTAGLGQRCVGEAAINFVLTALPSRMRARYRERTERYINMEAGHVAQNLLLQAVSLGLGAVPIGAFRTDQLDRAIGVDGRQESAIYLIPIGPR